MYLLLPPSLRKINWWLFDKSVLWFSARPESCCHKTCKIKFSAVANFCSLTSSQTVLQPDCAVQSRNSRWLFESLCFGRFLPDTKLNWRTVLYSQVFRQRHKSGMVKLTFQLPNRRQLSATHK